MDTVLKEKINLGISACMYGCKVRYNKKGWNMSELLEEIRPHLFGILCVQRVYQGWEFLEVPSEL